MLLHCILMKICELIGMNKGDDDDDVDHDDVDHDHDGMVYNMSL